MIRIKGLQKTSMIDYPGFIACTVFLPFCDFRCPFCHNPSLINDVDSQPDLPIDDFFSFLDSRKEWLDAVCITGGEPCLSSGLSDFIKRIKSLGFRVKLDTNGSKPGVLKQVISSVDYVAMDIKSCPNRYSEASGVSVDLTSIKTSVNLIRDSGVDYEFRTTVLPRLHSRTDLLRIGEWLEGSELYVLQQFRGDYGTLDPCYSRERAYSKDELDSFKVMLDPYFKKIILRAD